jgi:hypothetical protein
MATKFKDPEYSVDIIAYVFGVTEGRIRQFVKEGMPRSARNKYPLAKCVQWHANYWKSRAKTTTDKIKKLNEKMLKAKAGKAELDLLEQRGQLIDIDIVEKAGFEAGKQVKESLKAMVEQLSPNLAAQTESFKIKQIMQKEIDKTLENLAKSLVIE